MEMFWCVFLLVVLNVRGETGPPSTITKLETTNTATGTRSTITTTVTTPKPSTTAILSSLIRTIDGLTTLDHGVTSDKIMIIGNNTFEIPNFHFDGNAPNAHFLVGKGDKISENGTFVPLIENSTDPLVGYHGQHLKLTLPKGLTVDDIDWLAVWCVTYRQNLGYVFLKQNAFEYPPQTFDLNNEVTSGPVVLVDKKTLFVPNFVYKGDHKNVRFWVGNGSQPSVNGTAILDENGSSDSLRPYQGQNLNLKLPDGVSTDNIEYFGVWSVDEGVDLGHVPIKGIVVPEARFHKTKTLASIVMRVPKCCPLNSVLTVEGCAEHSEPFEPKFKVYEHNATHFNNESLDLSRLDFQPYTSVPDCPFGKYALNVTMEQFALLQNGSLLIKGSIVTGVLSEGNFCMDNVQLDAGTSVMSILVCLPEQKIEKAMYFTYISFTIISTFCFAITFFLYVFWLKVEDVHRKCFTAYVFAMAITFIALTIVQTANVEDGACEVLGFLFQYFMIASFTLLAILCFDIMIIVKHIDEDMLRRKRKTWYLGIAIAVPTLSLIISLARNLTPDVPNSFFKPQYQQNACYFESENQRTVFFYVPICLAMAVSCVCLVMTKLKIVQNDKDSVNDYFWIERGQLYKFMLRKHVIIFVTSLIWFVEAVLHLFFANASMLIAIDLVEATQGIVVLLLFVVNKQTRIQIVKNIKARRRRRRRKDADYIISEELVLT